MADVIMNLADMTDANKTSDVAAGIAARFRERSLLLDSLSYVAAPTGNYSWIEELTLPDVDWVAFNDSDPDSDKATYGPRMISSKMLAGKLIRDTRLAKRATAQGSAVAGLAAQMEGQAKALRYKAELGFFDGNSNTNIRQPDGLNAMLTDSSGTDQTLATAGTNGDVLTITMLEDLCDLVDEGGATALLMSKAMRREVKELLRSTSRITYNDEAGYVRRVMTFDDIPIIVVEKGVSRSEILGFDETCGTSSKCGSIYAVRFGIDGVFAIHDEPIKIEEPVKTGPWTEEIGIGWGLGFGMFTRACAARLQGVLQARDTQI